MPRSASHTEVHALPPCVAEAFEALGAAQRNLPERAMELAQFALGGGVLAFAIEHTGDLTHRMTEFVGHEIAYYGELSAGYGNVREKVMKVLRALRNDYGFVREHRENMASNARYRGMSLEDYLAKSRVALKRYVNEHRKLKVYNEAQHVARESAVALGDERFVDAERLLTQLERRLASREEWVAYATQHILGDNGCPLEYVCSCQ